VARVTVAVKEQVMDSPMRVAAWGRLDSQTAIRYVPYREGEVELVIGGNSALNLHVTSAGLVRLAQVVNAALHDEQRLKNLDSATPG
jgi:hypothetical protein